MLGELVLVLEVSSQRSRAHCQNDIVDRCVRRFADGPHTIDAPRLRNESPRARNLGVYGGMRNMSPGYGQPVAEAQPGRCIMIDQTEEMRRCIELRFEELGYRLELDLARLEVGIRGVSMLCLIPFMRFDRQR